MKAAANDLIVTLCGLATSVATAAVLATIEVKGHFAVYAFTLWFVIPIGAVISGIVATSGYRVGAQLLHHQLHRFFAVNVIGVSLLTYFLLNYMVYATRTVNGQHVSDVLSFGRYMNLVIQNRQMSFIGLGSLGKPGFFGYVLVAIQLVGFSAGGLKVYRQINLQLYCEKCRRYLTITWAAVKYGSLTTDIGGAYQSAKNALENGDSASAVQLFSTLSSSPSGTLRLALRLGQCPRCASEFYDLVMFYQDGKNWRPHQDFQARGVVRQGTGSPATAVTLAGPETIGPARIAVSLAALALPLAAILVARPAGFTDSSALLLEGSRYVTGKAVPRDEARGAGYFRKAALAGNTLAMAGLGELYRDGKGVPQDLGEARSWLEKAAKGGNPIAMFDLGMMYAKGQGVTRDDKQAADWYQKAAASGNADAMLNLGISYGTGSGVARNVRAARELFLKASKAGRVAAIHNLGWLDLHATPPNYAGAIAYFEQAAARGYTQSMTTLGGLYWQGKGVPRDALKARQWFQRAASAGDQQAMLSLGLMMIQGQGGTRDVTQGRQWLARASAAGNPLATTALQTMERRNPPSAGGR